MFNSLDPNDLEIVLNAMELVTCEPGHIVIKQGDDGDNLYMVEDGMLTVHRQSVRFSLKITIPYSLMIWSKNL